MKKSLKLLITLALVLSPCITRQLMAEVSCTADDAGPQHYDGVFLGDPPPDCVEGVNGTGVVFDSVQNSVSVANNPAFYPQTSFTIEAWIKTTATGGMLFGNEPLSGTEGWFIGINSDQHHAVFYGVFSNTVPTFGISNFSQVTDGNWHHYAITWERTTKTLRAYTDGFLGETKATAGPLVAGTLPLTFGTTLQSYSALGPILLDEVRISDKARYTGNSFTPTTSYVIDTNTIAYWTFGGCLNDTNLPVITCPAPISVRAVSPAGAVVNYPAPTATSSCSVSVTSVPPSGVLFPIGDTTVTCTATTGAGQSQSCTFVVHVADADEQLGDTGAAIQDFGLAAPVSRSLLRRLDQINAKLIVSQTEKACTLLTKFIAFVAKRQASGKLDSTHAEQLIADTLPDPRGAAMSVANFGAARRLDMVVGKTFRDSGWAGPVVG